MTIVPLQPNWETATDFNLFTDASGSIGYGTYFQGAGIAETWGDQHLNSQFWQPGGGGGGGGGGDQWLGKKSDFTVTIRL